MAHSDLFLANKLNALHSAFTNSYLLKHGNLFIKPEFPVNGFPYSFFPGDVGFTANTAAFNGGLAGVVQNSNDVPLNFAIKHEKPPTPPASTSPVNNKTPPPPTEEKVTVATDQSKNATWILGKQKLSWDNSTVASYNPETKMFRCVVCNAVGFLSRIAEHYLGTHTSAKVFQCLHCPYSSTWSRCVRMHMAKHHGVPNAPPSLWKGQPLLEEIFQLLTNLKTTVDSQGRDRTDPEVSDKKFVCPKCPYTTDRRDLYLRHENIHKEDKPYHCYICFKLFNRADHVKKHFLRIHRGHPYDISLVRRRPPKTPSYSTSVNSLNKGSHNNNTLDKTSIVTNGTLNSPLNGKVSNLNNGVETFKQAKGFECPFCTWEGADAWCLRRHMSIHIKSYSCPICDFKSTKAERLFTHVYKSHRMLVCTKCKYTTDQAQDFEIHIKDCCVEIVLGQTKLNQDDSANDSDTSNSSGMKRHTTEIKTGFDQIKSNLFPTKPQDIKPSMSIVPLHNSMSYCFSQQSPSFRSLKNANETIHISTKDVKSFHVENSKVEIKSELASPVQSSSDSGLAELAADQTVLDLTCWECGCEFANESSLHIHTELLHASVTKRNDSTSEPQRPKKKFSCALCNFSSKEQKTILDHMRFHTGESLVCRASNLCAFTTIFDSTLRNHVLEEHNDGKPRCPHCGFHCNDRVNFIRHYRKYHHSTSCYLCRDLKHNLMSGNTTSSSSSSPIQPYLHHNPYSKVHHGGNVPNVKKRQDFLDNIMKENYNPLSLLNKERRSRKQPLPRKLANPTKKQSNTEQSKNKRKSTILSKKYANLYYLSYWYCRKCYRNPLCYKNKTNFILHTLWYHQGNKFKCKICSGKFRYKYQVLLHKKRFHESNF